MRAFRAESPIEECPAEETISDLHEFRSRDIPTLDQKLNTVCRAVISKQRRDVWIEEERQ